MFREQWPSSAETWLESGGVPAAGSLWRNPALAAKLLGIATLIIAGYALVGLVRTTLVGARSVRS